MQTIGRKVVSRIILTLLLVLGLVESFVQKSESSGEQLSKGVEQRLLYITRSDLKGAYDFPIDYSVAINMSYLRLDADRSPISNSTFYDGNKGRFSVIVVNGLADSGIDSTEWSYIDSYEGKFNVTEGSVYATFFSSSIRSRFGIVSKGASVRICNFTFTTNNVRVSTDSSIQDVTLSANTTQYMKGGNNTMDKPLLWSYKDSNGVIRTAMNLIDSAPYYLKYWNHFPMLLALKLSSVDVLFNAYLSYDIDDVNMISYGPQPSAGNMTKIAQIYNTYGLPFGLMSDDVLRLDHQAMWNEIKNHPEAFDISLHESLTTTPYTNLRWYWQTGRKNLWGDYLGTYNWYMVTAGQEYNTTQGQYIVTNYNMKAIARGTTQLIRSRYAADVPQLFLPARIEYPEFDTFASWFTPTEADWYRSVNGLDYYGRLATQGYLIMWSHYQGFRNEQPALYALNKMFLTLGIARIVPARTPVLAMHARTLHSYNISATYYPSVKRLDFQLAQVISSPDTIATLILPTTRLKMEDAWLIKFDKNSSYVQFKYEDSKTYSIYVDQEDASNPIIRETNGWLTAYNASYNPLTFTISAPSGTTSTTRVYVGDRGKPKGVSGATSWSYNNETKIVTVCITCVSPTAEIVMYWIENNPPLTTIILFGTQGNNGWFTSGVSVGLSATDDISGVDKIKYSFDNATWTTYTMPFSVDTEGNITVYYESTDNAGNVETIKTQVIRIDKTAPTISVTFPLNGSEVRSSSVTVTWLGWDWTSGISYYEIRLNDGAWINVGTNTTQTFNGLGDGTLIIDVRATDKAGKSMQSTIICAVNANPLFLPAIAAIIIAATLGTAVYFFKIRKRRPHLTNH